MNLKKLFISSLILTFVFSSYLYAGQKSNDNILEINGVFIKSDEIIIKFRDNIRFAALVPEILPDIPNNVKTINGTSYLTYQKYLNSRFGVLSINRILPEFTPKIKSADKHKLSGKEWLKFDQAQADIFKKSLLRRKIKNTYISGNYFIDGVRFANLGCAYLLKLKTAYDPESLNRICQEYMKDPNIEYAHFNYIYKSDAVPNDPMYFSQRDTLEDINAPSAWDIINSTPNLTVAVIDDGVDSDHPDLVDRLIPGWNFGRENNDVMDDPKGHGTRVCAIIGASTNNRLGVAGINWNCKILPLKTPESLSTNTLSRMIQYAVDHEAQVINMSLGSYSLAENGYGPDTLTSQAVDNAYARGVVCVGTAGNDSTFKKRYPGALSPVICVASTDGEGNAKRAAFSNFGSWVDVAAPGAIYTAILDNTYGASGKGTSFSAPMVSGLAALVCAHYGNELGQGPDKVDNVIKIIKYSATKLNTDRFIGTGRINMRKALDGIPQSFAIITSPLKNSVLSGEVIVAGTAFGNYELFLYEKGAVRSPDNAISVGRDIIEQELGRFDADSLDEGWYTVLLETDDDSFGIDFYIDKSQKQGWPVLFTNPIGNAPNFGYIDDNTNQKVAVATTDIRQGRYRSELHLIDSSGFDTTECIIENFRSSSQPMAIADIYDTDDPDLLFTTSVGELTVKYGNFVNGDIWSSNGIYVHMAAPGMTWKSISSPVVTDLDNNGDPDILMAVDEEPYANMQDLEHYYKIYMFDTINADSLYPPIEINNINEFVPVPPLAADVDADGQNEIIIRTNYSVYLYDLDEIQNVYILKNNWPKTFNSLIGYESGIIAADINNDHIKEILAVCARDEGDSIIEVYAWNSDGTLVNGWPKEVGRKNADGKEYFYVTGLSVGNIDNDPFLEIAIGTSEDCKGRVLIWNHDGSLAFSKIFEDEEIKSTVLFADIDCNKLLRRPNNFDCFGNIADLDIPGLQMDSYLPSANLKIQKPILRNILVLADRPDLNTGITTRLPDMQFSIADESAPFGELDDVDIIFATNANKIYAYHIDGRLVTGFPKAIPDISTFMGGEIDLAVFDIDNDGNLELMASVMAGLGIYLWETNSKYNYLRMHWNRRMFCSSNNTDFSLPSRQ